MDTVRQGIGDSIAHHILVVIPVKRQVKDGKDDSKNVEEGNPSTGGLDELPGHQVDVLDDVRHPPVYHRTVCLTPIGRVRARR